MYSLGGFNLGYWHRAIGQSGWKIDMAEKMSLGIPDLTIGSRTKKEASDGTFRL